jgi:type IV secretory pathway TrbL component
MAALTFDVGGLPTGLWLVLAFILFSLLFGVGGQALSVIAWDKALAWGLQEDEPNSDDPMQRAFFTIEWGIALADVVVQSIAILMALYGLLTRHWIALVGGTVLFTILLYYGLAYFARCYAIKRWRLGDWTRWRGTAIKFFIIAETIGLLGLVGLWSNWKYFIG